MKGKDLARVILKRTVTTLYLYRILPATVVRLLFRLFNLKGA